MLSPKAPHLSSYRRCSTAYALLPPAFLPPLLAVFTTNYAHTHPNPLARSFPSPIFSRTNAMPTLADALASAAAGARGGLSVSGRHLQLTPSAPVGPVTEGHHPLLPRYGLEQLFCDLGLVPYLGRFQEEAIRLDMLLGMEVEQLERLGLRCVG